MNLSSVLIGSEDPKRLSEYYQKVLGSPAMTAGDFSGWQIGGGWVTVGPHDGVKGRNVHPGRIIWNIETEDVEGVFERFRSRGASVVREPYDPQPGSGMRIATFRDPDDNYFQLLSPM